MAFVKRIFLFLILNFLVCMTISFLLNFFHVRPYLSSFGLDIPSLMVTCFIWGMAGALISLSLSRITAKWMMGVQVVDPDTNDLQARELIGLVRELANEASLPMPQVGVFRSQEPNAFATGPTRSRSLVAVSTGLLQRMNQNQLKGVLAHELSHIANGDMVTMTLLQGVVNAFVLFLSRILAYFFSGLMRSRGGNSRDHSYASFWMFSILFEIVFMILGSLVVAAYSRWREFRADAGGAHLAGKESMISALRGLQNLQDIRDTTAGERPAYAALGISSRKRGWISFFATHPSLEKRIERLELS